MPMNSDALSVPSGDPRHMLLDVLAAHPAADATEAADVDFVRRFVARNADCFGKANPTGHITASAFVLDPAGRLLMTRHRKLKRWLQLGGHSDPHEFDPAVTALREATEESGLVDLRFHPGAGRRPIDVDVHRIPARKHEQAHDHLDVRYVLLTDAPGALAINDESDDLKWFELDDVAELGVDAAVMRVLHKLKALVGPAR